MMVSIDWGMAIAIILYSLTMFYLGYQYHKAIKLREQQKKNNANNI